MRECGTVWPFTRGWWSGPGQQRRFHYGFGATQPSFITLGESPHLAVVLASLVLVGARGALAPLLALLRASLSSMFAFGSSPWLFDLAITLLLCSSALDTPGRRHGVVAARAQRESRRTGAGRTLLAALGFHRASAVSGLPLRLPAQRRGESRHPLRRRRRRLPRRTHHVQVEFMLFGLGRFGCGAAGRSPCQHAVQSSRRSIFRRQWSAYNAVHGAGRRDRHLTRPDPRRDPVLPAAGLVGSVRRLVP